MDAEDAALFELLDGKRTVPSCSAKQNGWLGRAGPAGSRG